MEEKHDPAMLGCLAHRLRSGNQIMTSCLFAMILGLTCVSMTRSRLARPLPTPAIATLTKAHYIPTLAHFRACRRLRIALARPLFFWSLCPGAPLALLSLPVARGSMGRYFQAHTLRQACTTLSGRHGANLKSHCRPISSAIRYFALPPTATRPVAAVSSSMLGSATLSIPLTMALRTPLKHAMACASTSAGDKNGSLRGSHVAGSVAARLVREPTMTAHAQRASQQQPRSARHGPFVEAM